MWRSRWLKFFKFVHLGIYYLICILLACHSTCFFFARINEPSFPEVFIPPHGALWINLGGLGEAGGQGSCCSSSCNQADGEQLPVASFSLDHHCTESWWNGWSNSHFSPFLVLRDRYKHSRMHLECFTHVFVLCAFFLRLLKQDELLNIFACVWASNYVFTDFFFFCLHTTSWV